MRDAVSSKKKKNSPTNHNTRHKLKYYIKEWRHFKIYFYPLSIKQLAAHSIPTADQNHK